MAGTSPSPFLREHTLLLALAAPEPCCVSADAVVVRGDFNQHDWLPDFHWRRRPGVDYWLIVAPVMPLAFVLLFDTLLVGLPGLVHQWLVLSQGQICADRTRAGTRFGGSRPAPFPFRDEQTFAAAAFNSIPNADDVTVALLLDAIMTDQASMGLFWAGTNPVYNPGALCHRLPGQSGCYIVAPDARSRRSAAALARA